MKTRCNLYLGQERGTLFVRTADWNRPPWPGSTVTTWWWVILQQEVLVRNVELTSYHQGEEFGKGQKERRDSSPCVLPPPRILLAGIHLGWAMCVPEGPWVRMIGQRQPEIKVMSINPGTTGTAVLPGSLNLLLLFAQAPLPNKVSWSVSTCVSSDHLYLSVTQGSTLGPWKGSPFLQHSNWAGTHSWAAGRGEPRRQQLWPSGNLHLNKIWVVGCHGYHIAIQHDSDYIKLKSGIQSYILFVDTEIYRKHFALE